MNPGRLQNVRDNEERQRRGSQMRHLAGWKGHVDTLRRARECVGERERTFDNWNVKDGAEGDASSSFQVYQQ